MFATEMDLKPLVQRADIGWASIYLTVTVA